jgi:hypothetical protein
MFADPRPGIFFSGIVPNRDRVFGNLSTGGVEGIRGMASLLR